MTAGKSLFMMRIKSKKTLKNRKSGYKAKSSKDKYLNFKFGASVSIIHAETI